MSNKNRSKRYDVASKKEVKANARREQKEQRMTRPNALALALGIIVWCVAIIAPGVLYTFGNTVAIGMKILASAAIVLALIAQWKGYSDIFALCKEIKDILFPPFEAEYDDFDDDEDESAKRICAKCGKEIPDGDQCCGKCGTKYVPKPAPAKRICAKCGNEVSAENEYCGKCGTKYEPVKRICTKCGKEVRPENQYCGNCGTEYKPEV